MTKNRKVDDSELENVTGGTGESGPGGNRELAQADHESGQDLAEAAIEFGDDMIIIDREH